MLAAEGSSSDLASVLVGPASTEQEYIRPIADFFAGKQQTADLFAEAVCRAGWRLNSAAGQAVVLSYVLSMCKSPDLGLQAYMWVSASILAQPDAPWMLCDKGTLDLATVAQRAVPALAQRLGDGAVAGSAPAFAEYIVCLCGVLEQCKKGPDRDIFGRAARDLAIALQQVIAESGGTFEGLEPVWQALLQAAAELLVRSGASVTSGPVVGAVQAVPLLSADSYSTLLRRQLSGAPSFEQEAAFAATWSAAVSAATSNPVLAATPAFGLQRPDLPWLLQALPLVWQQLQSSTQLRALAPALLTPVVEAAGAMLTQQGPGSQQEAAETAAQLLDAVCQLLAAHGLSYGLFYTEVQGPVMLQVLALLQDHPELPTVQHLGAALSATVRAEVLRGDGRVLEAAERLAASQQLSGRDSLAVAPLYWDVVGAAAAAAAPAGPDPNHNRSLKELLLLYWRTAVLSAAGTAPSSSVAAALVAAGAADVHAGGDLAQQLLGNQPVPPAVLAALIGAAQAPAGSAVLPQLVAHACRFQQLRQLPATDLAQLLDRAVSLQAVSFADCLQLLQELFLQQQSEGWCVSTASAQGLVERVASSTSNQQQFEQLLQQHRGSAAAPALLCSMLQAGGDQRTTQLSWRLFQQMQQCGQPSQQQLPACSAVLVQQGQAGGPAAAERVLAVWQHCCTAAGGRSAAFQQLTLAAQQAVLSVLVASQQQGQTVVLVQHAPQLLAHLASLLQQAEQGGQLTDTSVLLHILELCVSVASKPAKAVDATAAAAAAAAAAAVAAAGETLVGLFLQRGQARVHAVSGELSAQLVQLLCANGRVATALALLPACLTDGPQGVSESAASAAIAAAAAGVTQSGSTEQQTAFLVQLAAAGTPSSVQAALSAALEQPTPAAAVLLLRAVRDSRPGHTLCDLLGPEQLQQLCDLVCSSSSSSSSSSSRNGSPGAALTVIELAQECCSSAGVPDGVVAQLLNTLCEQHPELQLPTLSAAEGSELSTLIARLCFRYLQELAVGASCEDLEASLAGWVPALTPEAATAALLATWQHKGGSECLQAAPSGAVMPLLCLELYRRAAPVAKAEGNSLVFELGLVAAAAEAAQHTGDWGRGAAIFAAAQKAAQNAADSNSSKRDQTQRSWLPTLPEACCALLSVLVHTGRPAAEGVHAAGQLLLREHEAQQGMTQQPAAAAGRKGKPAGINRQHQPAAPPSALLSQVAVSSFLAAAVSRVQCCQQRGRGDEAESAAQAAVQVTGELFKQQMVAVTLGAAGAGALALPADKGLVPDTASWGCLVQLYGVLGQWRQVSDVVLAAVRQQLPGVGKDGVEAVLAGAAAALMAAGRHTAAVQLLDGLVAAGVTAVSHPELAQQLVEAADQSTDAEQELVCRLAAGDEALYEALPDVAAGGCRGTVVVLVQQDAGLAMKKLINNMSN